MASTLLIFFSRGGGHLEAEKHKRQLPLVQDVSIIDLLVLDHQSLKESCQILQDKSADRNGLIAAGRRFLESLKIHSEAEKRTLYRELVSYPELHFNILEAEAEHRIIDQKIRSLIPKLKTLRSVTENTLADLVALAVIVEHHLLEEEGELFSRINEEVDEATLVELGEKFMKLRKFSTQELSDFPILKTEILEWKDNLQKMQNRYFAQIDRNMERLKH